MDSIPWNILLCCLFVYIAYRVLMRLILEERDRLQSKLMELVREHIEDIKRQVKLKKVKEKIRRLKAKARAHVEEARIKELNDAAMAEKESANKRRAA